MPSVFDDDRAVLEPPTWAELEARLGEPSMSFDISDPQVLVPQGLLACCRVVHQPHCDHHVAKSLVGCRFAVELPDGTVQERAPLKQVFPGDVLANPLALKGAVESARLMAVATAQGQGGLLARLAFDVWTLNLETAEIWRYLHQEREAELSALLREGDAVPDEAIEGLPIRLVAAEDGGEQLAFVMAHPSFRHARAYAHRVTLLPSEIGHDDEARYITEPIWGTEGDVSPAAEAILRDPVGEEVPW